MYPTFGVAKQGQVVMEYLTGLLLLTDHKVRTWSEQHFMVQPETHRAAFVWGMAVGTMAVMSDALAQGTPTNGGVTENTDPFTTVNTGICQVSGWLRGPVGIGLVIMSIIIAGISLAVGGKKSTSILIASLAGAAVILGARSIMSLAAGKNGQAICLNS
ncbi:TrbC/VirB2 family protein [Deinococcus koreensis]|nr:TrbC/VirB2 family protein [Deinococcus koreensis]